MNIKIELNAYEQKAFGNIFNTMKESLSQFGGGDKTDYVHQIREYLGTDKETSSRAKYGSVTLSKDTIDMHFTTTAVESVSRFLCKTIQRCGGAIHHFLGMLSSMKDMCHAIRNDLKEVENELTVPVESCKFCYQVVEAADQSFIAIYKYDGYDAEFYELRHIGDYVPENLYRAVITIAEEGCPKIYKMTSSEIEKLFIYDHDSMLIAVGETLEKLEDGDIYAVVEREYHDLKFAVMYKLPHGANPNTDITYINHFFPTCISCLMDENEELEELIEEAEDFFIHESRDSEELPDECEFTLTYREAEEKANELMNKFSKEMEVHGKREKTDENAQDIAKDYAGFQIHYGLLKTLVDDRPYVAVYEIPYPITDLSSIKFHAIASPIATEYLEDDEQDLYKRFKYPHCHVFDEIVSDPDTAMQHAQAMVDKLYKEWKEVSDSTTEQ